MVDDKLHTLATQLGAVLKARGLLLTMAESCTGGMVTQVVTSVAGSSAWFDRGFITYSNPSKQEMLGVSNQTLTQFGAVSEQTAVEMVAGALKNSHAQIAGSITGIAGPDGGTSEKPVGMVCFACSALANATLTTTQYFQGNREQIRQQATAFMMTMLIEQLKGTSINSCC